MTPDFHVDQAFWTPVVVDQLSGSDEINVALEEAILARKAETDGLQRTNVGGWHSDTDLTEWGGDAMAQLVARTKYLACANTVDRRQKEGVTTDWKVRAWANVASRGAYNVPHAHGGCYWSAIYYVRVDPGSGGDLVLHDPRMPMLEMHAPHHRFRCSGGERRIQTTPRAGMLILIPAWLVHSVSPWEGEGLRISIAMNLAVQ